jgi:hypothetical protein
MMPCTYRAFRGGATLKLRPEDVDFTGYPTAKTFVGKRGGGRVGLPSWG